MKVNITVEQGVTVTLDEAKFTPEFMAEFRESFYAFNTVQEHAEFLAQMAARGLINPTAAWVDGYGYLLHMGIDIDITYTEVYPA